MINEVELELEVKGVGVAVEEESIRVADEVAEEMDEMSLSNRSLTVNE